MAKADVISITTRRKLLGVMASAPVMAAPPVEATTADPHLGWLADYYADRARADQIEADDEANAAYSATLDITGRILETEPTTIAGVVAQLMVIVEMDYMGLVFGEGTTGPVLRQAAKMLPVPTWYDVNAEEA